MNDKAKIYLAILAFITALIFPLVGLLVGWWKWDVTTGILLMAGIFVAFSLIGSVILLRVRDLNWSGVFLPYIFGAIYSIFPDAVFLSLDDAAATSVGALFSFVLAIRKYPGIPKWMFIPLIAAGIYAVFGGAIPGPLDEFLIDASALLIAWLGTRQKGE